jgi:hypothetical protein
MRLRTVTGIAALMLVTAACSSKGASISDVSEALNPDTKPVIVTTTADPSRAASARIGPDGGKLTATGADGSEYSLEIPAGALVEEIEVRMTPITSMQGLPLAEGLAAGVQLEPEGMTFYDAVILTIDPAEALPVDQTLPIGSTGGTGALYIPFIDADPEAIRLRLLHFSSAGVSKGLLADIEPERERLGGDVEARLTSLANAEMVHARQAGETNPNANADLMRALEYLMTQFEEHVIKPRLAAAGESCAAGRLAIQTVLGYERQRQLLGMADSGGMEQFVDLIPTVSRVCLREEYELCRDEHIVHRMIPAILGMERQRQLLGITSPEMDQIMAEAEDLAAKCLRFELEFESQTAFPDGGVTSDVEAKVTLQYEPGSLTPPSGSSALVNTSFTFEIPGGGCTAHPALGGGTFTVISLNWLAASDGIEDQVGHVEDILLRYDPGQTTETVAITCPFGTTMPDMGVSGWWSRFFFGTHAMEAADSGPMGATTGGIAMPDLNSLQTVTYLAKGWDVSGDELFAELEWDESIEGIAENGSFMLYHRPE